VRRKVAGSAGEIVALLTIGSIGAISLQILRKIWLKKLLAARKIKASERPLALP
jgi:hypothetical protein